MVLTRLKARSVRWWAALAAVVLAVAGVSVTLSDWAETGSATAADSTGAADLNVVWTGQLSKFPGQAWRDGWGVSSAGAWRLAQLQMATDDMAPGGLALVVTYPAGSASPSCVDCPRQGGAEFRARTAPGNGDADLSKASIVDLRYSVRFPHEFDFGLGGSLPGLYGASASASGGTGTAGWSTRLIWRAQKGTVAGGVQVVPPGTSASAQELGVGTFTFTADDQWHAVEQQLELSTKKITLWYDRAKVYTGSLPELAGVSATGLLFSTFFGGGDTSWGPGTDVVAEFAGFTVRADLAVASPSTKASPSGNGTPHTTPTPGNTKTPKPTSKATKTPKSTGGPGKSQKFYVTLYGAHDNTPANSRDIAYPQIHKQAGGTGTYDDPITFATDKDELPAGTIIYYPYVKRYFIMEDDCAECDSDWESNQYRRLDLWAGTSNDSAIEECEAKLTQDGQVEVIVDPPSNLKVDAGELYHDGKCYSPGG